METIFLIGKISGIIIGSILFLRLLGKFLGKIKSFRYNNEKFKKKCTYTFTLERMHLFGIKRIPLPWVWVRFRDIKREPEDHIEY